MDDILFIVSSSREGRDVTVKVSGEIDIANAPALSKRLEEELEDANVHMTLDFAGVSFIDSEGVKALVKAYYRLRSAGGDMSIVHCRQTVCRVLDMLKLSETLGTDCAIWR